MLALKSNLIFLMLLPATVVIFILLGNFLNVSDIDGKILIPNPGSSPSILLLRVHRAFLNREEREERGERLVQIKERERPGFEPSPPQPKVDALDRSATVGRLK